MCNKKHKLYLNSNFLKHGSNIFFSTNLIKLGMRIPFHRNEAHSVKNLLQKCLREIYTQCTGKDKNLKGQHSSAFF